MEGEAKAWELLAALDPEDVCERAEARYSPEEGTYTLPIFSFPVVVDPAKRTMGGAGCESELVLTKAAYFSRLSILYYLIGAQKIPLAGRLVKPSDLRTGQIYLQGSHVLPLKQMAALYGRDTDAFLRQASRFGGHLQDQGDAATALWPFSRVPVTLVFWREDDEFPAGADLLFDVTCEEHLPSDILWSVAMLCVIVMQKR